MSLFGEEFDLLKTDEDKKYTKKVSAPIYEPSSKCPHILQLVDTRKTQRLISEIERSSIREEEKKFLIEAAHRHAVFNYSKIADYYAHATKEMQELMEKSALVIVDFDDAIALGYVKLSERIKKIQEETGRWASDEYKNQWRDTREESKEEEK